MEYTKTYNRFKILFNSVDDEIQIHDSKIKIYNISFRSELPLIEFMNVEDKEITENRSFSYPVFAPRQSDSNKVILLLHGLNERSWIKYLSWAYSLAEKTDSYVVLFPISFHINRSPTAWKDPRSMLHLLKYRESSLGPIEMSSFANLALSNRLAEDPVRFFKSGYQTVEDIVKLASDINRGYHPLIPQTSSINIFAYSIGAFLAEIIMMGNPGNIFSESKLFMFCGGSVFSNMKGASKFIMDKRAFDRVYNYFLYDFEATIRGKSPLVEFLNSNPLGISFRSMIDLGRFKTFRESILKKLRDQIHTITLVKDTIIPARGIVGTLGNFSDNNNLKVWDFPYTYSHENPFPVLDSPLKKKVDHWFERLFAEAALFLV